MSQSLDLSLHTDSGLREISDWSCKGMHYETCNINTYDLGTDFMQLQSLPLSTVLITRTSFY
jgi:hypothetical protein